MSKKSNHPKGIKNIRQGPLHSELNGEGISDSERKINIIFYIHISTHIYFILFKKYTQLMTYSVTTQTLNHKSQINFY